MSVFKRSVVFAVVLVLAACSEGPVEPADGLMELGPSMSSSTTQAFESGSHVDTWDPIILSSALGQAAACVQVPAVGLGANWQNPHKAFDFGLNFAVFQTTVRNKFGWQAPWINAWNDDQSNTAPGDSPFHDENWTRYSTEVEGDGTFVLRLSADNCSWIYLDGTLVATQFEDPRASNATNPEFGVTLSGTHTLQFIVFDGGGQAGGMFEMETTTNPPPPLNDDLDDDGFENDNDAFPLDPTEWEDTDGDGVGDNADPDDDNDGLSDEDEAAAGTDPLDPDSDDDGVLDGADAVPLSDTQATVVILGCDSGVDNQVLDDGSTFMDLVGAALDAAAGNHGEFVSAVTQLADEWKDAGLISGRDKGQITACAARSDGGKKGGKK